MKKLLLILAAVLVLGVGNAAYAGISLYYDLSAIGLGQTGIFDREVLTTVDATSYYDSGIYTGAAFNDVGDLQIGSFTLNGVALGSTAGLNSAWELTGSWNNLAGNLTNINPVAGVGTFYTFDYTSGTATLYADTSLDASFGGIGSGDDSGFTDGMPIATLSLITGNGALNDLVSGKDGGFTYMLWDIIDVPTGMWYASDGTDLESYLELYGKAEVNTLVATSVNILPNPANGPNALMIQSRNTGDVTYTVPEPASLLLLGSGLLGLAGVGFRRKKS